MNEQKNNEKGKGSDGNYDDRKPYEVVPRQLSNQELYDNNLRDKDSPDRLFPNEIEVDVRERLVNTRQFIVAGTGSDIDILTVGTVLWLEPTTGGAVERVNVRVLKSRKSAPNGKRYVLLETVDSLPNTNVKLNAVLEGKDVLIYTGPSEAQSIGVIHPTESHTGGGTSHSGQSNAYGVALLVKLKPNRRPQRGAEIRRKGKIATFEQDAELGTATVAVLDSGIRFNGRTRRPTSCSDIGWDFVADTADGDPFPNDDHIGLHGTKICSIIKKTAPEVGILPVKVSNSNGTLTLYDALCGLEYARTHGAKVVNASWSFTANGGGDGKADFPLLLQAIQDLEKSGIVVVAAAGNKSQYVNSDGHIAANNAPKIYPACYSAIQDNVITVTTVVAPDSTASPSEEGSKFRVFENYSNKFVDTGAVANAVAPEPIGRFIVPGFLNSYPGSSFATPYVAAMIAQVVSSSPGYMSKRTILHRLREFRVEKKLANKIRDGGSYITI